MGERGTPSPEELGIGAKKSEAQGGGTSRMELLRRKKEISDWGDPTPEDREILKQPLFRFGEKVIIIGDNGKVDNDDWYVVDPRADVDEIGRVQVEVMKNVAGRKDRANRRLVLESELAEINP